MARIKYWDIASQSWKHADQSIGKKGTSVTHSWDGTTLIVTSASGTSSANLKGDPGPKGEKGQDGTGVTILGTYSSEEELNNAHPTGSAGDSYLVNGYLYVWSLTENKWKNVGNIQGPQGEKGETGERGPAGKDGTSITHSWNDTTLTVTSASGTSSANLKGEKGDIGPIGPKGEQGIQGIPGADGPQGEPGISGVYTLSSDETLEDVPENMTVVIDPNGEEDAISSITHEWNGTVLTITSASGTSSADLQGPPGPAGANGAKGDKGDKGDTGTDGYTPVRGKDYWTEADKAEIVAAVIESLGGNPVFGYVDENNNIIVQGSLADGTYSVKYEMEDGSTVNIGNLVLDSNVYYSITNSLTNCVSNNSATQAVQGGSYSATITAKSGYELSSVVVTMGGTDISSTAVSGDTITIANVTGNIVITATATEVQTGPTNFANPNDTYWKEGYRLSISSGGTSACEGRTVTNFIPAVANDVLRVKGLDILTKTNDQNSKIVMYSKTDDESSKLEGLYGATSASKDSFGANVTVDGDVSTLTLLYGNEGTAPTTLASMKYIRIEGILMDGYTANDVIITINEPIV